LSVGFYVAARPAPVAVGARELLRSTTVITVTNGNDSGPGSLRQAIADAQHGDTIDFDPSVNSVTLTTAEIAISKSITVSAGSNMVTLRRNADPEEVHSLIAKWRDHLSWV
jgi:hypothetical protein